MNVPAFVRRNRLWVAALIVVAIVGVTLLGFLTRSEPIPSFRAQACGLRLEWLERSQRGFYEPRSGQISLLPRYPAYMAAAADGWNDSGPWPHLQEVPLVFYGPGLIADSVESDRLATIADIAPTLMTLMRAFYRSDGESLDEVARISGSLLGRKPPKLIVTIVWGGGGSNTLDQWPDDWPNLRSLMDDGVSFTDVIVGSSPSVPPVVHTTLGTGYFPSTHGITGASVRDESGEVVDAFPDGQPSRFIRIPTIAERWDEQNGNRALVGLIGSEPWHLGTIGRGTEKPGGDQDDTLLLDIEDSHARSLLALIREKGYGDDAITDLLFTSFGQIDRAAHSSNMASEEVHDAVIETDRQLGEIKDFLDSHVGDGRYVLVVTADHGLQPEAAAIDPYGIDPREVEKDIDDEFGPITAAVAPTEVFLLDQEMQARDVKVEDVARFLADYRLADNARPDADAGRFDADTRVFEIAIPARSLPEISCGAGNS